MTATEPVPFVPGPRTAEVDSPSVGGNSATEIQADEARGAGEEHRPDGQRRADGRGTTGHTGVHGAVVIERSPAVRAAGLDERSVFDPRGYATDAGLPTDDRRARLVGHLAWLVPMLAMGVLGAVRVTAPGLWADELATWGIVGLGWSDFWQLLPKTDAAVASYYVLLKGWVAIFGESDLALRLPSVLAMAGAAALVGRLGSRIGTPRTGLVAGLLFAVLPATSRYAQEARPYALTTLLAVGATLLLVWCVDKSPAGPWSLAAYGGTVTLVGLSHAVALALLLAHAFIVLGLRPALLRRWLAVSALACLPIVPGLWFGYGQRVKISWIASSDVRDPILFVDQFFGSPMVAAALICLAVLALSARRPSVVYSAWALLPAGVVLLVGQVGVSLWLPRYLLFTLPAWALLAALTIVRAPLSAALAAIVAVAAFGVSQQQSIRAADGHNLASREAARIIIDNAQPGDGIIYATDNVGALWVPRDVVARYVPASRRPDDLLLVQAQRKDGNEFARESVDIGRCLGDAQRLWLVRVGAHANPLDNLGDAYESPVRDRYVVERLWQPTGLTLALLVHKRG